MTCAQNPTEKQEYSLASSFPHLPGIFRFTQFIPLLCARPSGQEREEKATRAAWRTFKRFSALFQSFYNYPLRPPGGASEGPVVGNLRFPPRGPSLQPPPESPFPFRVERLPVRPASSCSNKSFAFGTLGLADTGSHGGATKLNASFSPFPPYGPAGSAIFLRSRPPPAIPPAAGRGMHKG